MMTKAWLRRGAMVGLCLAGCAPKTEMGLQQQWRGKSAPDFELTDLEGVPVKLSQFRGKPVLLAFWAFG